MSDFTVRADHIDVEHIMRQIRARIRDKRGADYTEAEIRELASVKLDRFLDPRAVRSDLLQHFRRQHRPEPTLASEPEPPLYAFEPEMVYASSRGALGQVLRFIRRLLNPIFKLFFNPNPLFDVVHRQGSINQYVFQSMHRFERLSRTRDELDALNFEMFNNLVVEVTRLGIEVKNLRMLVESLSTRLAFDERRARALEGVVQYRPGSPLGPPVQDEAEAGEDGEGRGTRRRRRRRGRRRGPGSGAEGDSGDRPMASAGSGSDEAPAPSTGIAESAPETKYPDEAEPADREVASGSGASATEPTGSDPDTPEPSES
jgi:hypothetical protein